MEDMTGGSGSGGGVRVVSLYGIYIYIVKYINAGLSER